MAALSPANWFKKKATTAIGLSIGTSSIKMAVVEVGSGAPELKLFGMTSLDPDTIINREIVRTEIVAKEAAALIRSAGTQQAPVCIGLSGPSVIIKRMSVEVQYKSELKDAVLWEAEQYFPFDFSQVALDYFSNGKIKDGKADVLLVGTKKSLIENYTAVMKLTEANLAVIDLDAFAMMHAVEFNYKKRPEHLLLIDFGASSIKLVVLSVGMPVFSKELTLGGIQLTEKIAATLKVNFMDAESLKIAGQSLPAQAAQVIAEEVTEIAREIKRTIDFYHASGLGGYIQMILIGGGGSKLAGLASTIEASVNISTQLLDPFNGLQIKHPSLNKKTLDQIRPFATIPIGLALRLGPT
jgi:type IV pilus assembly protein PilM